MAEQEVMTDKQEKLLNYILEDICPIDISTDKNKGLREKHTAGHDKVLDLLLEEDWFDNEDDINKFKEFINRPENIFRIENRKDFGEMLEEYLNEPFVSRNNSLSKYLMEMYSIEFIDQISVIPTLFSRNVTYHGLKEIGNNIKKIESYAFSDITFKSPLEIISKNIIIRNSAFVNCTISKLVIPETFRNRINLIFKNCKINEIVYIRYE